MFDNDKLQSLNTRLTWLHCKALLYFSGWFLLFFMSICYSRHRWVAWDCNNDNDMLLQVQQFQKVTQRMYWRRRTMTTGCGMHKLASISAAWTATAQSTALVASSMMKMYDQPATANEPCSHIGQNYLQFSKIWFIGCHFYEYEPICCQTDTLRPVLRSALGQKWHFCFTST